MLDVIGVMGNDEVCQIVNLQDSFLWMEALFRPALG